MIALEAGEADAASHFIAERCGLPIAALHAWRPDEIPRLATGKVDYAGLKSSGLERAAEAAAAQAATPTNDVARLYSRGLNRVDPAPDASFLDLGGDSLAYISVSIGLEEMLGHLPDQWQAMPIRSLQLLADRAMPATEQRRTLISTDVLLRLLAITLVFIGHAAPPETEMLRGGAGILFLLAGYSMAIRQLPQLIEGRIGHVIKGMSRRLVLPYYVAATGPIIALHIVKPWSWYAFVSLIVVPPLERRVLYSYWFFEDLVLSTLFVCVLFLIPPFRRAFARHPFAVSVMTTLATVAFCAFGAKAWHTGITVNLTLDAWLYVFMAGWTAGFARSALQKAIIIGLSVVAMLYQFGPEISRSYWLAFALIVLLTISAIPIKRNLRTGIVYLAGATYFMYLSHPLVVDLVRFRLATTLGTVPHIILVVIGSILCGVIGMEVWNRAMLLLQRLLRMTYNPKRT